MCFKKYIALILTVVTVFSLSACGKEKNSDNPQENTTDNTIDISQDLTDNIADITRPPTQNCYKYYTLIANKP